MNNRGYLSHTPDYTLTYWRGEVMGALHFFAWMTIPYVIGYDIGEVIKMFSGPGILGVARSAFPWELAKLFEQIWIIGMGLGLICGALWDEWNTPR